MWKIINICRKERRTKHGALRNTGSGEAGGRRGIKNTSNLGTVREIGLKPINSRGDDTKMAKFR